MSYLLNFCFQLKAKDVNVKSMKRIYIVECLILLNFTVIFRSSNATSLLLRILGLVKAFLQHLRYGPI
jgi:hypothetical protein